LSFLSGAALRSRLFLFVFLALTFWLPTTDDSSFQARGNGRTGERPVAWRRTEFGWEDASRWQLNATLRPFPTPATAVHPFIIASLELMLSIGALVIGSPSSRVTRR
jgi:hypothetical protein